MVFNLSALFDGVSLNSKLLKGPDLLGNQIGVILRFRRYQYAIGADIEKMFCQVTVKEEDAAVFRYFWRPPYSTEPPSTYQMRTHPFGATSSPAVCCFALQHAAKEYDGPLANEVGREVNSNFFMDNWLSSSNERQTTVDLSKTLISVLARVGFNLTQFVSSDQSIIRDIGKIPIDKDFVNLDLLEDAVERTLGLVWNYKRDCFQLRVTAEIPNHVFSKRELLRASARIYDPLGFLSAVKLLPKRLFQNACRNGYDWDDPLDIATTDAWTKWSSSLNSLSNLTVPRCLRPPNFDGTVELHIFADASEFAIGAIAYLRYVSSNEANCSFLLGKANLVSIKPSTIPRNELNAALLAANLFVSIKFELQMEFTRVVLWSDSSTVLRWLQSSSMKFTSYVASRVMKILEATTVDMWRYVPSQENPADDASRGIDPNFLHSSHRYFLGPQFLTLVPDDWPIAPWINYNSSFDPEIRVESVSSMAIAVKPHPIDLLINSSSSVYLVYRVIARMLRWKPKHRRPSSPPSKWLAIEEIEYARLIVLKHVQNVSYPYDIAALNSQRKSFNARNSLLTKLNPFLDENGLLRVGGRLSSSNLPIDVRQPILLPKGRFASLIILDKHRPPPPLKEHFSPETTLHELRREYWVPCGRREVIKALKNCIRCKLQRGQTVEPRMSDLPAARLQYECPAFSHTGVDYFGPFEVIIFRRHVKRWICLFTCLTTRSVHLELAYSLSTDSFISCISRFEARRGTPSDYYSDNGTNIVGAVSELDECLRNLDMLKIQETLAIRKVKWHFNPPAAPHFGGAWERLVGSAKRALGSVLHNQSLTDEVLLTAICLVESLLNSRPLTYLSNDPSEFEPLTPNHLLLGRANPNLPPDVFSSVDFDAKKRWRHSQAIASHFWRRWMKEVLPTFHERKKWTASERNLQEGDIVAILDANHPRGTWKLGRVTATIKSPHGVVRSAEIFLYPKTVLHRPAHRLCLLLPS